MTRSDCTRFLALVLSVALKNPATATTDLCLVFVKPAVSSGMMNLDWVQFGPPAVVK